MLPLVILLCRHPHTFIRESQWPSFTFILHWRLCYLYKALMPRILRLVSLSIRYTTCMIWCPKKEATFYVFLSVLEIYDTYESFTILLESSIHHKPFQNTCITIQELLFMLAICGPWAHGYLLTLRSYV